MYESKLEEMELDELLARFEALHDWCEDGAWSVENAELAEEIRRELQNRGVSAKRLDALAAHRPSSG